VFVQRSIEAMLKSDGASESMQDEKLRLLLNIRLFLSRYVVLNQHTFNAFLDSLLKAKNCEHRRHRGNEC
jgi:hypothetical protein